MVGSVRRSVCKYSCHFIWKRHNKLGVDALAEVDGACKATPHPPPRFRPKSRELEMQSPRQRRCLALTSLLSAWPTCSDLGCFTLRSCRQSKITKALLGLAILYLTILVVSVVLSPRSPSASNQFLNQNKHQMDDPFNAILCSSN